MTLMWCLLRKLTCFLNIYSHRVFGLQMCRNVVKLKITLPGRRWGHWNADPSSLLSFRAYILGVLIAESKQPQLHLLPQEYSIFCLGPFTKKCMLTIASRGTRKNPQADILNSRDLEFLNVCLLGTFSSWSLRQRELAFQSLECTALYAADQYPGP